MPPGVIALIVALAVAVAAGLAWRRTNGRMRATAAPDGAAAVPDGAAAAPDGAAAAPDVAAAVPDGAAAAPDGAAAAPDVAAAVPDGAAGRPGSPAASPGPMITGAELGLPLGQRATLVQFSTAFCAPCRATRRILAEVAGMTDGVAHVEIDAESHLDLVRRLDIRRTPTVLVVGPDGRIAKRASGQPRKADVIAALGDVC
jgi:thiol-disulfide isomerase/thioredoxin